MSALKNDNIIHEEDIRILIAKLCSYLTDEQLEDYSKWIDEKNILIEKELRKRQTP